MTHYYLGLDLGQRKDYTAIAVVEKEEPVLYRFDYVSWLRREDEVKSNVRGTAHVGLKEQKTHEVERLCASLRGGAIFEALRFGARETEPACNTSSATT